MPYHLAKSAMLLMLITGVEPVIVCSFAFSSSNIVLSVSGLGFSDTFIKKSSFVKVTLNSSVIQTTQPLLLHTKMTTAAAALARTASFASSSSHNNTVVMNNNNNGGGRKLVLVRGTLLRHQRRQRQRGKISPSSSRSADSASSSSSSSSSQSGTTKDEFIPQSYWVAESQTQFIAETKLPTDKGFYRLRGYRHRGPKTHVITEPTCMIYGNVEGLENVPVRVHDACFTSEVLGSLKCDCKQQLDMALEYIRDNELGVVIYLEQEGRGIGLANKIAAYKVQESGADTVDANRKLGLPDDIREYSAVRNIVDDLNIKSVALMTNNPRKINELEKEGVNVTSRIPCVTKANLFSEKYLEAKERRMSHVLNDSWRYFDNAGQVFESKDEADAKGDFSDYSMTWDEEDELGNIAAKGIH
jgi:GTP cyclohydrolase II